MDRYCERTRSSFLVADMASHVVRHSVADIEADKILELVALNVVAIQLSLVAPLELLLVSKKSTVIAAGIVAMEGAVGAVLPRWRSGRSHIVASIVAVDMAWLLPTVRCDCEKRGTFDSGPCGMPSADHVLCEHQRGPAARADAMRMGEADDDAGGCVLAPNRSGPP
jgi:hypothetical protein